MLLLLLAVVLSLTVLYVVFGAVMLRRLRKPTCRVCLFRQFCPNRESQHSKPTSKPCWSCGRIDPGTTPTQGSAIVDRPHEL
jgi:hypothetical protein